MAQCTERPTVKRNILLRDRSSVKCQLMVAAEVWCRRSECQRRPMPRVVSYCSALSHWYAQQNTSPWRSSFQKVTTSSIPSLKKSSSLQVLKVLQQSCFDQGKTFANEDRQSKVFLASVQQKGGAVQTTCSMGHLWRSLRLY